MCEVYSRSTLTISVPVCEESSTSFLRERRLGFQLPTDLASITHTDQNSTDKSRSWFSSTDLYQRNGPWFLEKSWYELPGFRNNSHNCWLERGWTLQEWILSPRVLHLDSITMWDCFDSYADELFRRYMERPRLIRHPAELGKGISWAFIVEEYSKRRVTHEKDRLPALAGLAARYSQATGRSYLAGLWREDLPGSLLWERLRDSDPSSRMRNQAPSWSWASLDGAIWCLKPDMEDCFIEKVCVSSTFCQYNPPDSFSEVIKAWIDLDCCVSIVTARREDGDGINVKAGGKWWDPKLDYRGELRDDEIAQRSTYLLLMGCLGDYHSALVIRRCEGDEKPPCYRRLGIAWFEGGLGEDESSPYLGPQWERRAVRLV